MPFPRTRPTWLLAAHREQSGRNRRREDRRTGRRPGGVRRGAVTFRVGTGAGALNGGLLAPGESFGVRFRVRVNRSTAGGTGIVNQATVDLHGQTLPSLHLRDDSPPVAVTVAPAADHKHPVRMLKRTDTAQPGILVNAAEIRQIEQ